MKIAVIGAGGFIGNRLVEQLHLATEHTIVPVVRTPSRLALPARFSLEWRIGDALDLGSLTHALLGCDAVVHAALGDPRQIEAMPAVLAAAAAAAGVPRIVYLSTASVHGQAPATGTTEASPLRTDQAMDYNNAKVRAERSLFEACGRHAIAAFALRPGVVYGPRSRWITDAAADLREGRTWLLRGGSGICNAIYVDNLGAAVASALTALPTVTGAYLIGDAETVTWREFYERIAEGLGLERAHFHTADRPPEFHRSAAVRFTRLVARPEIQRLLPAIPGRIKQVTKRLLAAAQMPPRASAWNLPAAPAPRVTEELSLLQQCTWKLPHTLATEKLGYRPPVAFPKPSDAASHGSLSPEGRAA